MVRELVVERVAVRTYPVTCNSVLFLFKKSGETRFLRVGSCGLCDGQESDCSACFCCFCFAVRCMRPSFLFALYYEVTFQFVAILLTFFSVFFFCILVLLHFLLITYIY